MSAQDNKAKVLRTLRILRLRVQSYLIDLGLELHSFFTGKARVQEKKPTLLVSKDGSCALVRMPNNQLRSLDRSPRGKSLIKRWRKFRRAQAERRAQEAAT